jgi:predicted extracellular nuclease
MFTVMTWNVENFFVPDPSDSQDAHDRFDGKLSFLAGAIVSLDPDVVALQELGSAALASLQGRLGTTAYPALHEGVPDGRGIRVGILSRLPFENTPKDIVAFTGPPPINQIPGLDDAGNVNTINRMGRGAAQVTVLAGTTRVHLIACHLKSKLLTFPGGFFSTANEDLRAQVGAIDLMRRTAEAAQVRLAVNELMSQHPDDGVIVLGDLNDSPYAACPPQ